VLIYVARRLLAIFVQALIITTVVFGLLRLLPGDPSYYLAGPQASQAQIDGIRASLRLDQPIPAQYTAYLENLMQGDWGRSIRTKNNVLDDIKHRLPATLELITLSLVLGLVIMVPLGVWSSLRQGHPLARLAGYWGRLSGSLPDFWIGILLVLIFYTGLHIAPAPVGRLDIGELQPSGGTGFLTLDSLLHGRLDLFASAAGHLALPVATLTLVYSGMFYRQTRAAMQRELETTRVLFAEACGLPERQIAMRSLRNSIAPVLALVGNSYAFMLGGAVLVETVFSWGGLGQYAVDAVQSSDYFAISGVVLVTALFTLMVYFLVDLLNAYLDPRIRTS
jgi:peptide/nickel transport system permease protein